MLFRVEKKRHLDMMKDPGRKDGFEGVQKLAQVIGRDVNKYVTELPEENNKPIDYGEVASSAVKFAAIKQTEKFHTIFIFIFVDCHADADQSTGNGMIFLP